MGEHTEKQFVLFKTEIKQKYTQKAERNKAERKGMGVHSNEEGHGKSEVEQKWTPREKCRHSEWGAQERGDLNPICCFKHCTRRLGELRFIMQAGPEEWTQNKGVTKFL